MRLPTTNVLVVLPTPPLGGPIIDQLADKTSRAYVRSSTLGLLIPPTAA
jgi:hypothetical protein